MSEENKAGIKALKMFDRDPEQWELLNEIERLNKRIEDLNIINEEHKILNEMLRKELQQKENIIKEVEEYIEDIYRDVIEWETTSDFYSVKPDLLEILGGLNE